MELSLRPSLLVVDDDAAFRSRLARALEDRGFAVRVAASVDEAVVLLDDPPEYAVVDLRMPGRSGLDLLSELKRRDVNTRVVMLSGYGSIPNAVEATRLGATNFLTKPADADDVVRALFGHQPQSTTIPTLAENEWEYICRVLRDTEGNVSEAARRLGLHRRSLQRKLQRRPDGEPELR